MRYNNAGMPETTHGYVSTAGKVYPPDLDIKNNIPLKFKTEHDVYNAEPPKTIKAKLEILDEIISSTLNGVENIRHDLFGSPAELNKCENDTVNGVSIETAIDIITHNAEALHKLTLIIGQRLS